MALGISQTLRDARWNHLLVEALGNHTVLSDVFKTEMIPRSESQLSWKWVIYQKTG
jgi:hypothetical protein